MEEEEEEEEEEEGEEGEEEGSDSIGQVLGGEGSSSGRMDANDNTLTTPSSSSSTPLWGRGYCIDERDYLKVKTSGVIRDRDQPCYHQYYDTSEGDLITDLGEWCEGI